MSNDTLEQLQDYISKEPRRISAGYFNKDIVRRIQCTDGTTLSVQASQFHYCSPRSDYGPYNEVEVGFPSTVPPQSWMEFCEDKSKPTETVYGYIPISLVASFIDEHGGIDFAAMRKARPQ